MLLVLTQPNISIPALLHCIDTFTLLSAYCINWDKSEVLPLSCYCPATLFNQWKFRWSPKGIKYLGILVTPSYNDMVQENFKPLLQKMKNSFARWSSIYLSLWGKINSLKMMTAPIIYYILAHIPLNIPNSYFKEIDRQRLEFLWKHWHEAGINCISDLFDETTKHFLNLKKKFS